VRVHGSSFASALAASSLGVDTGASDGLGDMTVQAPNSNATAGNADRIGRFCEVAPARTRAQPASAMTARLRSEGFKLLTHLIQVIIQ
jgi:hypothetical protein